MNKITLTDEHIAAAERQRRIVVNFDVSCATNTCSQNYDDFDAFAESLFTFTDADGSQIDSLWWSWSEGNQVPYKSEFLPLFDDPSTGSGWRTASISSASSCRQPTSAARNRSMSIG